MMLDMSPDADADLDYIDAILESDDAAEEEYINAADAGRMGKAVEHLVAAACILSTRGNLNVSRSGRCANARSTGQGTDVRFENGAHQTAIHRHGA